MTLPLGRQHRLALDRVQCSRLTISGHFELGGTPPAFFMEGTHSHEGIERAEGRSDGWLAVFGTQYRIGGRRYDAVLQIEDDPKDETVRVLMQYDRRRRGPTPAGYSDVAVGLDRLASVSASGLVWVDALIVDVGRGGDVRTAFQTPIRIATREGAPFTHVVGVQLANRGSAGDLYRVAIWHHLGHVDAEVEFTDTVQWSRRLPLTLLREVRRTLDLAVHSETPREDDNEPSH